MQGWHYSPASGSIIVRNSNELTGTQQGVNPADADFRLGVGILMASGMAALGHELLWTRRMIDLLGASTESSARVFECFFLGLSLGAAFMSFLLPRIRRHWHILGWVELGVAVLSVPALLLPQWTGWIWPDLGPDRLVSWQGSAIKTLLSSFILLPPTFLMGMTLPMLIATVVTANPYDSKREILLYAANTIGGVVGLGVVVLISLHTIGSTGSMLLMMGINVGVAVRCFLRGRRDVVPAARPESLQSVTRMSLTSIDKLPLIFAFFSGAGVLSLEVLGLALANLSAPLSFYPQGSILICVILLLAAAAWLVAKIRVRPGMPVQILSVSMAATGLAAALAPTIFFHLPGVANGLFGYGDSFEQFLLVLAGTTLASLGPALLFAGTIFPAITLWSKREDSVAGRRMGLLLAVSGLGGIAGTEIAYRLLLPSFAVHVSMGVVGLFYGLASLVLGLIQKDTRSGRFLWSLTAFLAVCIVISSILVDLPVYYQAKLYKVVDLHVGREGSLAVVEDGRSRVMIFDNQYTLGGTWVTPSLRRQAHLPLLLHPAPAKVGFIGLGTGITASGALEHKAVESITAVELSALVAESAARNFDKFNHGICHNPKAKILVEDARIYLEASKDSFDVIIGDLFTPWRPGEASLSSLEEFRAVQAALREGGVFCQWIELTQWTPEQFQVAAATFRRVFGHLYLFRAGFGTGSVPVGLVGFKSGSPDWSTVASRSESERRDGHLVDPLCRHPEGVAMLYLGEFVPLREFENQINTLNNLRIELSASRQVVLIDSGTHYSGSGDPWLRLLDQQSTALADQKDLPGWLRSYPKLGALATQFEIALGANDPSAKAIAQRLMDQIPLSIRSDPGADLALWPGSVTPWQYLGLHSPFTKLGTPGNGPEK